ncbi:hypothetical protein RJV04_005060 [Salmonella enterica]|nr:hypothetical protein [Salmonella enterica]
MNKMTLLPGNALARHLPGKNRRLTAVLLAGLLAPGLSALPVSQATAVTGSASSSSATLTLQTKFTKSTCLFTRNGAVLNGIQEVSMPVLTSDSITDGDWYSAVVPLELGLNCPEGPESDVVLALTIMPDATDTSRTGGFIASKKLTGEIHGPDLLLWDTHNDRVVTDFSPGPELVPPGSRCNTSSSCLEMGGNKPDFTVPLGIKMFVPAAGGSGDFTRESMMTPGIWQSVITLNIAYR